MLTPDCAQIKPLGRLVPMSVHLARELGAISGHGGGDNTAYGSIGTFLHKPVEPLSFRFLRRQPSGSTSTFGSTVTQALHVSLVSRNLGSPSGKKGF